MSVYAKSPMYLWKIEYALYLSVSMTLCTRNILLFSNILFYFVILVFKCACVLIISRGVDCDIVIVDV